MRKKQLAAVCVLFVVFAPTGSCMSSELDEEDATRERPSQPLGASMAPTKYAAVAPLFDLTVHPQWC